MSETGSRCPRKARHALEGEAALAAAIRKAAGVEAPTFAPAAAARLAAIAGLARAPVDKRSQPAPFPAWAIAVSGLGMAAVAVLARFAPLSTRFPGSLLAVLPVLNLLCSPVAAFTLVKRRRQHAR